MQPRNLISSIFEYETQKVVSITSMKIGLIYRFIQLIIVLYVVLYVMIHQKGYQVFDEVVSGVTSKLKGIDYTNVSGIPALEKRLWDVTDYAVPPLMNSAFFVTTNAAITENQQQGECDEHPQHMWHAGCQVDANCTRGENFNVGSGIKTGRCVQSTFNPKLRMCEVRAWCPVENDELVSKKKPLLQNAKKFTVMIKNSIEFPYFKVKRRNILKWMTKKYLRQCRFIPDHETYRYCPIFVLEDIVKYRSHPSHQYDVNSLWTNGGMVAIDINWNCNLDYSEDECVPRYSFRHLEDNALASGNNFRYAHYYRENGTLKRTLIKAYGIHFFINVNGHGGRFSFVSFSMNLGSGIALLGLATVLCDMIVLNFLRKRKDYREAKVDKTLGTSGSHLNNDEDMCRQRRITRKWNQCNKDTSNVQQTFDSTENERRLLSSFSMSSEKSALFKTNDMIEKSSDSQTKNIDNNR